MLETSTVPPLAETAVEAEPKAIEDLTHDEAIDEASDNLIAIFNLKKGLKNQSDGGIVKPLQDQMIESAQSNIYGLQAETQEIISVHSLKSTEVLGKVFEKDNELREARNLLGSNQLLRLVGLQFGALKPQG